jgi:hypothetical protein
MIDLLAKHWPLEVLGNNNSRPQRKPLLIVHLLLLGNSNGNASAKKKMITNSTFVECAERHKNGNAPDATLPTIKLGSSFVACVEF